MIICLFLKGKKTNCLAVFNRSLAKPKKICGKRLRNSDAAVNS